MDALIIPVQIPVALALEKAAFADRKGLRIARAPAASTTIF
jgi:hypothetical protein